MDKGGGGWTCGGQGTFGTARARCAPMRGVHANAEGCGIGVWVRGEIVPHPTITHSVGAPPWFFGAEGTVTRGRFPWGCEGTVTRSRLLDKGGGGGGVLCNIKWTSNRWPFDVLTVRLHPLSPPPHTPRVRAERGGRWGARS